MGNLGNLFFKLGIKDEDAQKVITNIEKRLEKDGMKVKLRASNANEFLRDLREQLKSQTLEIKVKSIGAGLTGTATTPADLRYTKMLAVQQRMADATAVAQQRLVAERNRDTRAAEKHAVAMRKSNKSFMDQSRLLGQLKNQILDVYSIYTMENFLVKVMEIGGEFQKQHLALNAMLGDAEKGDAIFSKIKSLAVESPFNFRELMGFTKQIAAFGIPYEEMYETTKRLADISAGLGVDMGRIILAYGQVRSATVLRGQELRQFTEAGIPLVDELAKKFTELEGRVVSAGEVFDKISNKEVSFGMVKDVLWQLTNEGGKFYNMQEVLTESLSGKLAKLRDSWEIMLSTIAEGNNGVLGGTLDLLTKLTEQWEKFWTAIKMVIAVYGTYKAIIMFGSVIEARKMVVQHGLTAAINANTLALEANNAAQTKANLGGLALLRTLGKLKTFFNSLGGFGKLGLVIGAIVAIGSYLYDAYTNAHKLSNELNDIAGKNQVSVQNEIDGYKILVEKLGQATDGTEEYKNIKDQIISQYGSYIGEINKEANAYEYLKSKIDDVTTALQNKAKNSSRQQMLSAIEENYSEDLIDEINTLKKRIKHGYGVSEQSASEIIKVLRSELQKDVNNNVDFWRMSIEEVDRKIKNIAGDLGISIKKGGEQSGFALIKSTIYDITEIMREYDASVKEMDDILDMSFGSYKTWGVVMDRIRKDRDSKKPVFKSDKEKKDYELTTLQQQLNAVKKIPGSIDAQREIEAQMENLKRGSAKWVEEAKKLGKEIGESFVGDLLPKDRDIQKNSLTSYFQRLRGIYEEEKKNLKMLNASLTKNSTESDKQTAERAKKRVKYIEDYFKANNVPLKIKTENEEIRDANKAERAKKRVKYIEDYFKANAERDAQKEANEQLQAELRMLKDHISEITQQWKVFKNVVEKTGNKDFAFHLAFGEIAVGESGEMKEFRKKVEKGLEKSGVSFSDFLLKNDADLEKMGKDYQLLKPYADAYKDAQRELRKETADNLTELVTMYRDYAARIEEIERKKEKDITDIRNSRGRLKQAGIDPDRMIAEVTRRAEDEKGSVLFEQFKKSDDWVRVFDNLDRVSSATLDNMVEKMEMFSKSQHLSVEDTKEMSDALQRLRNEQIERNPWKGIGEALKEIREIRTLRNSGQGVKGTKFNHQTGKIDIIRPSKGELDEKELKSYEKLGKSIDKTISGLEGMLSVTSQLSSMFEALGENGIGDFLNLAGGALSGATSMQSGFTKMGTLFGLEGAALKNLGFVGMGVGAASAIIGGIAQQHDKRLDKAIERSKERVDALKNAYDNIEKSISQGNLGLERSLVLYNQLEEQAKRAGSSLSKSYSLPFEVMQNGADSYIKKMEAEINELESTGKFGRIFLNSNHEIFLRKEMLEALKKAGASGVSSNSRIQQEKAQYASLVAQRKEIENQLRNEEKKKDPSKSKIQDYQNQIHELNSEISTFIENLASELYAIDFDGWAGQISDALVNAFANGENAAEAFENVTKSIMKGIANAAIKNLVVAPMFDKLKRKLFGDENGNGGVFETFEDLEGNGEKLASAMTNFFNEEGGKMISASKEFLQALDKASNGAISESGDNSDSSSIKASASSITEEAGNLIASYLNAVRADVSVKRMLQERFFNEDFPKLGVIAESQLTQLRTIADNTARNAQFAEDIYNLLHRNTTPGKGFKIG